MLLNGACNNEYSKQLKNYSTMPLRLTALGKKMKNSIQPISIKEIKEIHGGHDGPHVHIGGFHPHEIVMLATSIFIGIGLLYTKHPYLAIGATTTIITGIGIYLWNTNDETSEEVAK